MVMSDPPTVPTDIGAPLIDPTEPMGGEGVSAVSRAHSFQSFGQYSQFLRSAVADEESLQMGERLQALAAQIESLVGALRQPKADSSVIAQALMNLLDDLRSHRAMLLELGGDWHAFYEFDAHFAALTQLRTLVTQWAREAAPPQHQIPLLTDFDLVAWRVLGAGALLLDVYEQSRLQAPAPDAVLVPVSAWSRLSRWWRGHLRGPQTTHSSEHGGRRKTDG